MAATPSNACLQMWYTSAHLPAIQRSHLNDAPFGKATAQGNVKSQRSRGNALPADDEGSLNVPSSQVAISGLRGTQLQSTSLLVLSTKQDNCMGKGTRHACTAGSQATHTLLAALLPSCMMLPLPKRAFMSFITASSALACSESRMRQWWRLVDEPRK